MINIKSKILKTILPLLILTSACNKLSDFGSTNVNPGAAPATISGLFATVTASLPGFAYNVTGGYYCQYFSETQYSSASLYSLVQSSASGVYSGSAYDCTTIMNMPNSTNNQIQAAKVAQDLMVWYLTDLLGDIPYSQAFLGTENTSPAYDKQEDIYKGLISDLTAVSAAFDNSLIFGDVTNYNGDPAGWRRLANSMRLLMALRLSKKYPGASDYAATQIKAALADPGGLITSNSQNLAVTYPGGPYKYPIYNTYDGRKDLAESKTMTDLLGSLNDPRSGIYGGDASSVSNASSSVGVPYGVDRTKAAAFTSANPGWAMVLRGDFRTPTSTYFILSAAEVFLARAEAADRGWTSESVSDMYTSGIIASFAQWKLPAPSPTYLSQSSVALSGETGIGANIQQIATQRYLSMYPNGTQGWAEWRRTGYPTLVAAPDAVNGNGQIPRRYAYSPSEYNSNGASVEAAVARIPGGDSQFSSVWWDQ